MARNKKKKKRKQPQRQSAPLSPENYIRKKARNLPLDQCYISADWKSEGIANVFVIRAHKNGNKTIGIYLVDLKCLGIKETFYAFNAPESQLHEMVTGEWGIEIIKCDYNLAHHMVYGSKKFAELYGLQPHKIWSITENILEPDDESIPIVDIEFGDNGMPHYISGPNDDIPFINGVINTLKKTAGQGNYYITIHSDDTDFSESGFDEDDFGLDEDESDFAEEYFGDEDASVFEAIRTIALLYFVIFPDEEPKILPDEIVEGIVVDDEKYGSDLSDEDCDYIYDTIEDLEGKSRANQNQELEKLGNRYTDSPDGLQFIYFSAYGILEKEPTGIGDLIEQKYPDQVDYTLLKSYQSSITGNPDRAWELLRKSLTIRERFPQREGFRSDEWVFFLMAMLSYFTAIDDLVTALSYAGILINDIEDMQDEFPMALDPLGIFFGKLEEKFAEVDIPDLLDNPNARKYRNRMRRL